MNLPALVFGLLIASGIGLAYHLIRGGSLRRMLLYLLSGWIGFAAGQLAGEWLGWHLLRLGALNLFAATLGALLSLLLTDNLAPEQHAASRPTGLGPPPEG